MSSRFVLPFVDVGSGISPSDGATLDFFESGTSTRKDTFKTEALDPNKKNANPVVANGDGVFPDIFLPDGGRYKVRLRTKVTVAGVEGKQIFESDPVVGGVSASLSSKTFDTVAAMVASTELNVGDIVETAGYLSIGNGGDNRYEIVAAATGTDDGGSFIDLATHQAKGLFPTDRFTVKMFGAAGDGSTNDTTEIGNAESFAQTNGLSLLFTDGNYITDSLTIEVTTKFEEGAKISVNAAQTVTLNMAAEAGLYHIFDGSGSILLNNEESHIARPEWFGAFPNEPTVDSGVLLQKLSDSVVTGRECFVPVSAGTYFLQTKVTWSRACRIFGVGERITHFRCTTDFPTGDVFVTAGEGVTFQNIQFSTAITARTSGAYLGLDNNFCRANNIWFTDGFNGIRVDGDACKVRDVTGFLWATGVGAYIVNIGAGTVSTVVEDITYIDSTTFKPDYIVRVESAAEFVIDKVNAKGFSVAAVGIVPTTGTASQGQIDNIIGKENGPSALLIKTIDTASIESIQVGKVQADGLSGNGTEFRKEGSGIFKFVHIDQLESRACSVGFKVSASTGSIDHWHVTGGFCRNNTGNGYDIADADQWTINGTESVSNTGTGTLIALGCNDFIYSDNRNRFNTVANFTDNSGGVTKVVADNLN